VTFPVAKLGEVCSFVRGLTYSKSDEVEFSSNIVVRATNIDLSAHKLDFSELRYISDSIQVKDDKRLKKDDILICTASGSKSHLGKVAIVESDLGMAFGGFMGALRVNPSKITPKYLFTFLVSDEFKKHIESLSDGANINNLKFSQIENLQIPLPPIATQQKIVAKLDAIFGEIDRATAAAEANARNAEALFQSYLSQVFGNIGDGWESLSIGDICEELFAGGDVPKDRMSKEFGNGFTIPIFTNGEKDKGLYGYTDKARVSKPSITVSARGTIGYSQVRVEPFFPAIRLIVATPKDEIVELDFLKYAIKSLKFIHSGASIPQLTVPMIKDYRVTIPNLKNEQLKIVKKIDSLNSHIEKLKNSETKKAIEFSSLKKVILKQAFSGELVKE
jgi:type I restriction enzyme S subunit